jgi:hypothetical protein
MTSVLRRYAQIDPRSAFFIVLESPLTTWTVDASGSSSSLMSFTQFTSNLTEGTFGGEEDLLIMGNLLKDLGRQITVYDDTIPGYPHVAIFRQVLYIDNTQTSETEGIGTGIPIIFYICVWAQHDSDSFPQFTASRVARTG